jgi:very-short-patch-repair endonuclease
VPKFIVDFYCQKAQLVIELDGGIHKKIEVSERDEGREAELQKFGIKILRFTNNEVLSDIENVISRIKSYLK